MGIRNLSLASLLLLASLAGISCSSDDPMRFNLEGRYLLTMQVEDSNCAWNILSGEMVIQHDQEDILLGVVGRTEMNPGDANPLTGSFTVTWEDDQGGTQTMQGSSAGFDSLAGDYNATRPDAQSLNGCFLIASWSAQRL
jgi:hypothetical protein